jgi:hypothetical protein
VARELAGLVGLLVGLPRDDCPVESGCMDARRFTDELRADIEDLVARGRGRAGDDRDRTS